MLRRGRSKPPLYSSSCRSKRVTDAGTCGDANCSNIRLPCAGEPCLYTVGTGLRTPEDSDIVCGTPKPDRDPSLRRLPSSE